MTNTYGYNRKTREEDEAILAAVKRHHDAVTAKGYTVIITSLVGSQNYDLDDEQSDIDTYSFIVPSFKDIVQAKDPYAGMFEVEDGHCNIKDIRLALNLLKKASPNSVEYFTSKYKVYNPVFEKLLKEYMEDNSVLWHMIHCNYKHMLYAMAGMAHQLTIRNMTPGKRFAHALRLDDMFYHFFNSQTASAVLDLRAGGDRDLAMIAKRDTLPENEESYNREVEQIAEKLTKYSENFTPAEDMKKIEIEGITIIENLQLRIFKLYLGMELENV